MIRVEVQRTSPEIEEFVRRCEAAGDDRFGFRLPDGQRQLRLELQYDLQCRYDEQHTCGGAGRH
ncbi:hypothetical protein OIE76_42925 (plasmid) [Streptomyces sp. NBC_01727]|nr:hypothetical protein OIE76_42925 [Streptomyces sp. NBC_01727]